MHEATQKIHEERYMLKKLVRLGCITQGSLAGITNQRFSLKYQTFRQLAAAFISGEGSSKLPKRLVLNPLQSGPDFTPWDLARTSGPQRNVMGQSTEMSPLVSMLFRTFLNPLKNF